MIDQLVGTVTAHPDNILFLAVGALVTGLVVLYAASRKKRKSEKPEYFR